MRVLFTAPPAKVHLYTQVPLAWALRAAGHEVRVAARPTVIDDITATGLTAVPVGADFDPAAYIRKADAPARPWESWMDVLHYAEFRPEKLTYDYMHAVHLAWTLLFKGTSPPDVVEDLTGFARAWRPDLVIWDMFSFAGPVAAKACGAAHARLLCGLDLIGRMRERYLAEMLRRPPGLREDPLEEWLGRYADPFAEDMVMGQWTIDAVPSSMRLSVDHFYVPMRGVSYNGRAVIPEWLREPPKRPRVCLTLGLSYREVLGGDRVSVRDLLDAVGGLDVEVVATLTADQIGGARVPDNVRVVDFVPLNELLPTCSAIVHQGGFGQSQSALVHGVPQVVVPHGGWDTVPRALRLRELGAGLCGGDVREMLVRVLREPSFAREAERLRVEALGTPAPGDVVPLLEKLTAARRS
ncbi:activator-dependent family glycosyltransferase [Streptosporangium sp. LJ11]|uniref:activator-dependent family glycosyltransferase n=1 Tax=Streptosporangium sp. LJ11 TaxID=3436927 RepID=UPI003F7A8BCD